MASRRSAGRVPGLCAAGLCIAVLLAGCPAPVPRPSTVAPCAIGVPGPDGTVRTTGLASVLVYPDDARRAGHEGRAVVRVQVGADGQPQRADVRTSSGHASLDDAALRAVMQCSFGPSARGGRVASAWFNLPIAFRLQGERPPLPAPVPPDP